MPPVRDTLFGFDPYENFDPAWAEPDVQGWGHEHGVFEDSIKALQPRCIIEVGTWKGASALRMAEICRAEGLETEIVCVDTWLGPPSIFIHSGKGDHAAQFNSMRLVNGYPMIYYTFMRNVVDAGAQDMITPLAQTSENAAKILRYHKVQADLIYMDAAADKEPVFRDLMFYWPLVRPGGHLVGDDFKHKQVRAGMEKFCDKTGLTPEVLGGKYRFVKT